MTPSDRRHGRSTAPCWSTSTSNVLPSVLIYHPRRQHFLSPHDLTKTERRRNDARTTHRRRLHTRNGNLKLTLTVDLFPLPAELREPQNRWLATADTFPRAAEFRAKPRNLRFSAKFWYFCGISGIFAKVEKCPMIGTIVGLITWNHGEKSNW